MGWRNEQLKTEQIEPAADTPRQNDIKDNGVPFDRPRWSREIGNIMAEIGKDDPGGGCWEWVKVNLAGTWRRLMAAMTEIDAAFEKQCTDSLADGITQARRLYRECISAWNATGSK